MAQINASYGDTPAAYTLVLTLISEDQTWLVDQMRWMENDQSPRSPVESAEQLVKAYQEAVLSQDYARLASLYNTTVSYTHLDVYKRQGDDSVQSVDNLLTSCIIQGCVYDVHDFILFHVAHRLIVYWLIAWRISKE